MFHIGPFAITINGLGAGKKTGRRDYIPETIQLFRQDCISTSFQNGVLIVIVADGHGPEPQGSLISSIASKFIIEGIHSNISEIKDICLNKASLHEYMTKLFTDVDNFLYLHHPQTKGILSGGSTLTVNVKMLHPKNKSQLVSFTCNVGDSPMIRVSGDSVKFISKDLNADRLESYQHHIDYCNKFGKTPMPAIIGRLNMPNNYPTPWMGPVGNPIKPFKIEKVDGKWTAKIDSRTLSNFHTFANHNYKQRCLALGGSQSLRDRKEFLEQVERARVGKDTYPEYNFGNTVGNLQCLPGSCFGDASSKKDIDTLLINTSLEIWKRGNTNDEIEFICSDGIIDILDDATIVKACLNGGYKSKDTCNELYAASCKSASEGHFPFYLGNPCWDDLSLITVKTEMKISKSAHKKSNQKKKAKRAANKKRHRHK